MASAYIGMQNGKFFIIDIGTEWTLIYGDLVRSVILSQAETYRRMFVPERKESTNLWPMSCSESICALTSKSRSWSTKVQHRITAKSSCIWRQTGSLCLYTLMLNCVPKRLFSRHKSRHKSVLRDTTEVTVKSCHAFSRTGHLCPEDKFVWSLTNLEIGKLSLLGIVHTFLSFKEWIQHSRCWMFSKLFSYPESK